MEEHLGQTAYHVAKSKPGVSQTILQLLQNPTQSIDRAKVTGTTTTSRLTEKLAQAKKTIERLTRKNKELREKIVALEAAANPQSLSEMEQKFDALLQNKISNLGAKVEILMENWMSNLESRLGILHVDDPDNLVSKCSRFEAL
jgi:predicted transcriptional regulator